MTGYENLIKSVAVEIIRTKAKSLKKRDTDNVGADDAGGRALDALASGLNTIDLSGATNPKSLRNIGLTLVAVGEKLQEEADTAEEETK